MGEISIDHRILLDIRTLGVWRLKRNREEIISQILNVCMDGAIKTRVVYQSNLNFKTVEPYLYLLVKNNLLEVQHGKKKLYETTKKGENLLKAMDSVNRLVGFNSL
jgi:predicted transcriptional regulator